MHYKLELIKPTVVSCGGNGTEELFYMRLKCKHHCGEMCQLFKTPLPHQEVD